MDPTERITELEREVASLRAQLVARGDSLPPNEDPGVARLLADRSLLAKVPDVIAILDRNHRVLYINRVLPGRQISEFLGTSILDHLVESEREERRQALERAWETGQIQSVESRSTRGTVWDNRLVPIKEDGRVTYLITIAVDVTESKRTEEALRENASKLRHALDATGMGTWVREGDVVRWDENLCRILGIDPANAPTTPDGFYGFIHPDDAKSIGEMVQHFRDTGIYEKLECRVVRPDGSIRHTIVKASIELDENGDVRRSYGGVFDVTEQKALEERLRQSEKMDAIGHLTAGIAHNFNNILGIILPNVELCRKQASPAITQRLDDIMHAAERGAEMVRQLMLFARSEATGRKVAIDVSERARRTVAICRSTFDPSIHIQLNVAPSLPSVRGNAGQIEQMLLNICLNARDAFEQARTPHPTITISLDRAPSGAVRIRVEDNGPGMDEETRSHIFAPFFTTKTADRGTGLGLASVLAIVTDHLGVVRCESTLSHGTTFEIELPATHERPAVVEEIRPAPSEGGTETVLVADDEPLVRSATRDLLELGGYHVLEADDGMSTLAVFEEQRDRIAAVILDRSMPGLSGDQVLRGLAELAPSVPVIMLSGHLGSMESKQHAAAVLTKPTSAATLLRTVREVIDRAAQRRATERSSIGP